MTKTSCIKLLFLFTVFCSTKSFSQIFVEKPEFFKEDIQNDSILNLYSIEYNSSDSNIVYIIKYYMSGKINSKWSYTSLSDSIINKYEIWYENGNYKRIFTLISDINQKKLNKFFTTGKNPYWFYHMNRYYNGELKTYWENGQIKRHNVFSDSKKLIGSTWNFEGTVTKYYSYSIAPEFPGGDLELRNFISNTVKYPELAKEYGIQGIVYVSFVVDTNGKVKNIEITKSVAKILDDEAIRIINLLPDWNPGVQDDEKVKVSFTVPINFQIN